MKLNDLISEMRNKKIIAQERAREEKMSEHEWKDPIEFPEGKQTGEITKVIDRTTEKNFKYTDVFIKLIDVENEPEIKYSCPTILSQGSKLGKLLESFGEKYEKGKKSSPEKILVGRKVTLKIVNVENNEGKEFAEIVKGSLKPEEVTTETVSE